MTKDDGLHHVNLACGEADFVNGIRKRSGLLNTRREGHLLQTGNRTSESAIPSQNFSLHMHYYGGGQIGARLNHSSKIPIAMYIIRAILSNSRLLIALADLSSHDNGL